MRVSRHAVCQGETMVMVPFMPTSAVRTELNGTIPGRENRTKNCVVLPPIKSWLYPVPLVAYVNVRGEEERDGERQIERRGTTSSAGTREEEEQKRRRKQAEGGPFAADSESGARPGRSGESGDKADGSRPQILGRSDRVPGVTPV